MWRAWVRLCVGPCRYPRRRFCHPKDLQQNRSAHVTRCTEVCWGRNIWAPRETVVFQHGKEAASAWRNVLMGQELLTVVGFTSALLSKTFQVSRTCFGEVCCFVRYLDFKQVKVQNGLALTKASRLVRSGHLKNNRRNVWGAEGGGEERTEGRAEEDVKNTCVQCWLVGGWGFWDVTQTRCQNQQGGDLMRKKDRSERSRGGVGKRKASPSSSTPTLQRSASASP